VRCRKTRVAREQLADRGELEGFDRERHT
jgi:hypothetical protein